MGWFSKEEKIVLGPTAQLVQLIEKLTEEKKIPWKNSQLDYTYAYEFSFTLENVMSGKLIIYHPYLHREHATLEIEIPNTLEYSNNRILHYKVNFVVNNELHKKLLNLIIENLKIKEEDIIKELSVNELSIIAIKRLETL